MTHLFSPEADRAIDDIIAGAPLLALDFDGTLAPIVAVPDQARAPVAISRTLAQLGEFLPIAIVTGRSIADVRERLGFEPHFIVGNHGAEGLSLAQSAENEAAVTAWWQMLDGPLSAQLDAHGVIAENKTHSVSLHYRLARDRDSAIVAIQAAVARLDPPPRIIEGKCVVNILPCGALDKFGAVSALLKVSRCDSVIFAGDDTTDDVVFENAPANWLTVRIEAFEQHRARFHLNHQSEVSIFLQRLLRSLQLRKSRLS